MSHPKEDPSGQASPPSDPSESNAPSNGNRTETAADDKAAPLPTSPSDGENDAKTAGA